MGWSSSSSANDRRAAQQAPCRPFDNPNPRQASCSPPYKSSPDRWGRHQDFHHTTTGIASTVSPGHGRRLLRSHARTGVRPDRTPPEGQRPTLLASSRSAYSALLTPSGPRRPSCTSGAARAIAGRRPRKAQPRRATRRRSSAPSPGGLEAETRRCSRPVRCQRTAGATA